MVYVAQNSTSVTNEHISAAQFETDTPYGTVTVYANPGYDGTSLQINCNDPNSQNDVLADKMYLWGVISSIKVGEGCKVTLCNTFAC
jgi:hypothetical protein